MYSLKGFEGPYGSGCQGDRYIKAWHYVFFQNMMIFITLFLNVRFHSNNANSDSNP